jgi:hypothetical protein
MVINIMMKPAASIFRVEHCIVTQKIAIYSFTAAVKISNDAMLMIYAKTLYISLQ